MSFLMTGSNSDAIVSCLDRSQAIIEFRMDGTILRANANFCSALGYEPSEIVGRHHRIFVDPVEVVSREYQQLWESLRRGEFQRRQFRRIAKSGKEIWIEASYNPVLKRGRPFKVIKFATDITASKLRSMDDAGIITALQNTQAVIQFNSLGEILDANDNFCNALGYNISEILGKHHRMFCPADYANSEDYRQFWQKLGRGESFANEFLRIGKGGKEVWIQAAYNPIIDPNGKVCKVVKIATDVTERMGALSSVAGALKALANGNLMQNLEKPFVPTMEALRQDLNEAIAKLRSAMQSVGHNAKVIACGSREIRIFADELARRTERQAAAVEQTAAALEEITSTVVDSNRRADEARSLVASASTDAERSGLIVKKAIVAMGEIEGSSQKISNIIGVIDDIAFQTNLLALNAGVEAARAGESGKGFAVVAQEVRELAQRSAKAAKEIKILINASGEHVKRGVTFVGETSKSLTSIVGQVKEIDREVEAIVKASKEQAISLKEINQSVNMVDQANQQNAALVAESTAASYGLAQEAQALFGLLGQFQAELPTNNPAVQPDNTAFHQQHRLLAL